MVYRREQFLFTLIPTAAPCKLPIGAVFKTRRQGALAFERALPVMREKRRKFNNLLLKEFTSAVRPFNDITFFSR